MFFRKQKEKIKKELTKLKLEIEDFKLEMKDLKTTIETINKEATETLNIMEDTNISVDGFPELDYRKMMERGHIFNNKAHDNNKVKQIEWVKERPSLKIRKIFHGGCLSCVSPLDNGIGYCLKCQYIDADWSKPNLSNNKEIY